MSRSNLAIAAWLVVCLAACDWTVETVHTGPWGEGGSVTPMPVPGADDNGNGLLVWHRGDGIYTSTYAPASGWSAAQRLSSSGRFPDMSMAPTGTAYAAWGISGAIRYSQYDGVGWSPLRSVGTTGYVSSVDVDTDEFGRGIIAWSTASGVYAFGPGTTASTTLASTGSVHVALDLSAYGHGIAAWCSGASMWAATFHFDSGFGPPQRLGSGCGSSFNGLTPFTAGVAADGSAHVVWSDTSFVTRRFDPATGWGPLTVLDSDVGMTPRIAVNKHGSALLSWVDTATSQTMARTYAPDSGWHSTTAFAGASSGSGPRVALDDRDIGWVVRITSGVTATPYVVEYGPLESDLLVDKRGAYFPSVATSPNGRTAVAWQDGVTNDVLAATLDE